MRPRILIPEASRLVGEPVRLDGQRSHHLVRVLRLRAGDAVECFDGLGARFEGTLESADPRACTVRIGRGIAGNTESPLQVTLLQCVSGSERMDWTIEKAVELGAAAISPLSSARSPQRLDAERAQRRREHWQRLIEAACMQCGRDLLPRLHELQPLERWLAERERSSDTVSLVLAPAAARPLREIVFGSARQVELLVGPESGLTDRELDAAESAGFTPVRLGPRTLRTETAGLAALAALQALAGDF